VKLARLAHTEMPCRTAPCAVRWATAPKTRCWRTGR